MQRTSAILKIITILTDFTTIRVEHISLAVFNSTFLTIISINIEATNTLRTG